MKTYSLIDDATNAQKLAALKQLVEGLLEQKYYPRELVSQYIASYVNTFLLGQLLRVIPRFNELYTMSSRFRESLSQAIGMSPGEIDIFFEKKKEALDVSFNKFSKMLTLKDISNDPASSKCLNDLLRVFDGKLISAIEPKHMFLEQFPRGCEVPMSQDELRRCLNIFPVDRLPVLSHVRKFIYDEPEIKEIIAKAATLSRKKHLTPPEQLALNKCYEKLCARFNSMVRLLQLNDVNQIVIGITTIVGSVTQTIIGVLQGKYVDSILNSSYLLGPPALSLPKNIKNIKQITGMEQVDNWSEADLLKLYEALRELEAHSIPWKKYLNRALAMVLPIMTMVILFINVTNPYTSTIIGLTLPICITLLKQTIYHLHYLTFIRRNFAMYSHSAQYYLNSALLRIGKNPILADVLMVKPVHIVEDWQLVQLQISIKPEKLQPQQNYYDDLYLITEMFHKYHIDYIVIKPKSNEKNKIIAIYVNEAEVYDRLGLISYQFWKGCYHTQFADQLRTKILKQRFHRQFEHTILQPLRKQALVRNYWLNEDDQAELTYQLDVGLYKDRVIPIISKHLGLTVEHQQWQNNCITIILRPQEDTLTKLTDLSRDFQNSIQSFNISIESTSIKTHVSVENDVTDEKTKIPKRKNRLKTLGSGESSSTIEKVESWRVTNGEILSTNDNVYLLKDTLTYQNPIYVTHELSDRNFDDPFIYKRIIRQLEIGRFAAPRGQQGIFITDQQQKLTVKVLGTNGTGDLRIVANGFIEGKFGSHLYVLTDIVDHQGKKMN